MSYDINKLESMQAYGITPFPEPRVEEEGECDMDIVRCGYCNEQLFRKDLTGGDGEMCPDCAEEERKDMDEFYNLDYDDHYGRGDVE